MPVRYEVYACKSVKAVNLRYQGECATIEHAIATIKEQFPKGKARVISSKGKIYYEQNMTLPEQLPNICDF